MNMQQTSPGTSQLILCEILVRVFLNRGSNDSSRHKKRVQKFGLRRSSMGSNAGVHAYCSVAKVSVRGTEHLHYNDVHKNTVIHG